jgi:histidine ammonia-lyase
VDAEPIALDGATLQPAELAAIARADARVRLTDAAYTANETAAAALAELLARGEAVYGATTGVGDLRDRALAPHERAGFPLALLRSHAGAAGRPVTVELVRAAMAVRANQIGAGGAGVDPRLVDAIVGMLNAGLSPFTRELGSLGTGDLTALADIGLAAIGEGRVWREGRLLDAGAALVQAGITPGVLGPRDGLAFMSSNAMTIGHAALLTVDVERLLSTWLAVAALSFEAAGADPVILDARIHSPRHRPGQAAIAAIMRRLLAGLERPERRIGVSGIQDPYPFRALPQVDGAVHDALEALRSTVGHEMNFAGENALIIAEEPAALPNGNPHAAPLAGDVDGLRMALAQSSALVAARVSTLLDTGLTGLPPFLAERPGPDSGALILEYTAHAAAAEVRSLVTPVSAQTVSVSRGVESHASLAPIAVRRASETLHALEVLTAVELVVAVRALRMAGREPVGAGTRPLFATAAAILSPELADRPLHPDVEAARVLVASWTRPPESHAEGPH